MRYLPILLGLILITSAYAFPDKDKDSIPDNEDICDDSFTTLVDTVGCSCEQITDASCSTIYPGARCCKSNEFCVLVNFKPRCAADSDNDNILDVSDNCPFKTNPDQKDSDANGIGDVCEKEIKEQLSPPAVEEKQEFVQQWSYDAKEQLIIIQYAHSKHLLEVDFDSAISPDDVLIRETSSSILNQVWSDDHKKFMFMVEGDSNQQGITKIESRFKPLSVKIDGAIIPQLTSTVLYWIIASLAGVIILLFVVLLRQKKKSGLEELLELKTYIIDAANRGFTPMHIRHDLIKDGWDRQLVDRAFHSLLQPKKASPQQLVEMQNYIATNLRMGMPKHHIRDVLAKDGWSSHDIHRAFKNLKIVI